MNNFDGNYTIMGYQASSINEWKTKLKEYLSDKTDGKMNLYIVSKDWLNKYEAKCFNAKFNCSELIKDFNNSKTIYTIPKIFVLDKDYGLENKIIVEGIFKNNILLIDMSKYSNSKIFIFFYLSQNNELIQGHLLIKKIDKEKDIINDLINIGPNNFKQKYRKEYMKTQIATKDFNMILHEYEKPQKKNNILENNVNRKDEQNYQSNNDNKNEVLQTNLGSEKGLENKNNIISEENPSDTIEKSSNSLNINPNLGYYEKLISKKNDGLKPKKVIIKNNIKRNPSVQINKKILGSQRMIDKFTLEKFLPNKVIHNKSTPGLIGLLNIGATCYMNATLQCFSNIGRLRAYLLSKEIYKNLENEKDTNKKLSFALAEVLKNLWEKLEQRFYAPENFKNIISEKNELFKGIAANDPKDLIIFLLQTIHKELNNPPNNTINYITPNETNLNEVFYCFSNEYSNKNKSIISDEFYGYTNSSTTCSFCNYNINNVQILNILFFPLEEIRKFKNYKHKNVFIIDCFEYYEKTDIYPSFHCNNCKSDSSVYSQTKIVFSPRTLIINLNRGKGIEFSVNIIYEEYLNLRKFILHENSPYYYELIGVICHLGSNDEGGHFIAYCKNSENCEWYKYNDQFVTKCYFDEVKRANLPYVLIYSYVQTS